MENNNKTTSVDEALASQFQVKNLEPRLEVSACYDSDKKMEDEAALLYL